MQGVRKKFTNKAASTVTAYFLLLSSFIIPRIYCMDLESSCFASAVNSRKASGQVLPSSKNSCGVTPKYSQI